MAIHINYEWRSLAINALVKLHLQLFVSFGNIDVPRSHLSTHCFNSTFVDIQVAIQDSFGLLLEKEYICLCCRCLCLYYNNVCSKFVVNVVVLKSKLTITNYEDPNF